MRDSIRIAAAALTLCAGTASAQWSDDFNRPNGPIGGDWVTQVGIFEVVNNAGESLDTANQWMSHSVASAAYDTVEVKIDVFATPAVLQYVALMVGVGGADNLYVKVQGGSTGFGQIGFYRGFNNPSGVPWASPFSKICCRPSPARA